MMQSPPPVEHLVPDKRDSDWRKKRCQQCLVFLIGIAGIVCSYYVGTQSAEMLHEAPVVHLDCGPVEGTYDATHQVNIFMGIPYATPPTGNLRWRRTVPVYPDGCWSGTLKATTPKQCTQVVGLGRKVLEGEEDCLTLDIRVPSGRIRKSLVPVVVTIHPGGLILGNSTYPMMTPNAELTRDTNVVFVSMNYRLGLFGFLVAKELGEDQTGNYGIWDIIEALKWVQKNIKHFGGDPNEVTLSGPSSGGSVALSLLFSPHAKGLMHRVWATGVGTKLKARLDNIIEASASPFYPQVKDLGCHDAACLRNLPIEELYQNPFVYDGEEHMIPRKEEVPKVYIDGDLYPGEFEDVVTMQAEQLPNVTLLLATNSNEKDLWFEDTIPDLKKYLMEHLDERYGLNLTEQALAVYNLTLQDDPEYVITALASDITFTCGNNRIARAVAKINPVYRYVVTHTPTSLVHLVWSETARYAFHCYDGFVFFNSQIIDDPQQSDLDYQQTLRGVVKEFLQTGRIAGWETFPKATALIDTDITFTYSDFHQDQCEFWKRTGFFKYETVIY